MTSDQSSPDKGRKGLALGLILLTAGTLWLLRKADFDLPSWLFQWEILVIATGLFIGLEKGFKNAGAWILITIGAVFLISDAFGLPYSFWDFIWPLCLVVFGLVLIYKARTGNQKNREPELDDLNTGDDFDSTTLFNELKKKVLTQDFKGGSSTTVLGETKIDLSKSDIQQPVKIDGTAVLGSLHLIVPRDWEIKTSVTVVLGAVNDKRHTGQTAISEHKIVYLTGTVVLGNISIESSDF